MAIKRGGSGRAGVLAMRLGYQRCHGNAAGSVQFPLCGQPHTWPAALWLLGGPAGPGDAQPLVGAWPLADAGPQCRWGLGSCAANPPGTGRVCDVAPPPYYVGFGRLMRRAQPQVIHLWQELWSLAALRALRVRDRFCPHATPVLEVDQNLHKRLLAPSEHIRRRAAPNRP